MRQERSFVFCVPQAAGSNKPKVGKAASRLLDLGEQAVLSRLQLKEQQKAALGGGERVGSNADKVLTKTRARPVDRERDDFEDAWDRLGK